MLSLTVPLVLASRSPRRRALLGALGLPHRVVPGPPDDDWDAAAPPAQLVEQLALMKASPVAAAHPDALTLGADTVVVLDDTILGKPNDAAEARATLRRLSGATHAVYTGLALLHDASGRRVTTHECTNVTFAPLSDDEIARYVVTGSPLDKAGAYGIQDDYGALFVSRIEGDYYNVVGLPLHRLYQTLRQHFADLLGNPVSV